MSEASLREARKQILKSIHIPDNKGKSYTIKKLKDKIVISTRSMK